MNNDKIVLKDGTEIELESSQGIGALHVVKGSRQQACALWEQFTNDNLKQVAVKNSDGLTVGIYQDMVLDHIEGRDKADGTVQVTLCLRSKSAVELMEERLSAVETGQQAQDEAIQTHNEAIGDLGQVMSDIVEGGGQ